MTSFEQPDAGLLVEDLLPSLLGTSDYLSESQDRSLFFGELGTALERLRGRLTLVSSPSRETGGGSRYPWLWRYVSHFTVGSEARAVQHAKLWVFHWRAGDEDFLELHVSSTNLTPSAFKDQVQAGWRVMLPLGERSTQSLRRSWGELVPFLEALGASAGALATERIERLISLLGRVACPDDVTFIASIPGQKSAARQLAQFAPSEIHILAPTVGEWNEETLAQWSKDAGVAPAKLHLKWVDAKHPWASPSRWTLSLDAYQALRSQEVSVERLADDTRFVADHRSEDLRWSHAKLYLLRKGRRQWTVVTSANWSLSAWGAGSKMPPRNFELGVAFPSDWKIAAGSFTSGATPYVAEPERNPAASRLHWAQAGWDGKSISLSARSTDGMTPIDAVMTFSTGAPQRVALVAGEALLPWDDATCLPIAALFEQDDEVLAVHVQDCRPPCEFSRTPLPEVDPDRDRALLEALLLQRYGGPHVDPGGGHEPNGKRARPGGAPPAADYVVQAWRDARSAFGVVDKWRAEFDEAEDTFRRDVVHRDGEKLRELFARREGASERLAAEELGWYLGKEK